MGTVGILGTAAFAVLALAVSVVGWVVAKRPLAVFAWATRRALGKAGLRRLTVDAPAGPQTVFVGGSGPVLVLLHGAGDQAGTWLHAVRALAKVRTLVVPDLAGHGDSAPGSGPIPMDAVVQGLEAVLDTVLAGRTATLAGNSLGAWLAMLLARRHPGRFDRVVAVNGGPLRGINERVGLLPTTRAEARETVAQLRDASSPAIPDPVLDDLVRQSASSPLARLAAARESMEPWLLEPADLAGLTLPVRLVWGASDRLLDLDYAERVRAALPDAALIVIQACGHIPQQEAPGPFLDALRKALDLPA